MSVFEQGLDRNAANHVALSPVSFLRRAAAVAPSRLAVVHGERRYNYAEFWARSRALGSALQKRGIGRGDCVSIMGANTPEMLEAHNGVPMIGAVLNSLNTRLDAKTIAFILDHGESKLLLTDREFSPTIKEAVALLDRDITIIDIDDALADSGELLGETDYESLLAEGDADFDPLEETEREEEVGLDAPGRERVSVLALHQGHGGVRAESADHGQVAWHLGTVERERGASRQRRLEDLQIHRGPLRPGI